MAIIRRGEIIAFCTPREALARIANEVWEATVSREEVAAFKSRFKVISTQMFEGRVRVRVLGGGRRPGNEFSPATPTLEDYYFSLVARQESVN
jgi:hypothetical protein